MSELASATGGIRRPTRLGEEVYDAIYARLMTLTIPPGYRISIDSLARDLGVSQTPIREALSRLEAQGLVTKVHLVGYSATNQIDRPKLAQLYELRLLLEPFIARSAAQRMSQAKIAEIEGIAAEMTRSDSIKSRDAYSEFARKDARFHDLLAEMAGNAFVRDSLARLHVHVHLFRLHYHSLATRAANDEHELIIQSLRHEDGDGAERAMRTHVEKSRDRFLDAAFDSTP